jgi:YegS/Rv2252/BmrU family lipid kinase
MMSTSPHKTLILINPAAARASDAWREIRAHLMTRGLRFDEHITTHPGDAEARTRDALNAGYRTIVAMGGDGTLSETASGFFVREGMNALSRSVSTHAALALLPAGTGDDFARGLAGKGAPLSEWLERLIRYYHETGIERHTLMRKVDVLDCSVSTSTSGNINRFICLNAATLGIGAEVATRVAGQGRLLRAGGGEARFAIAALGALARWRSLPVRITVDDVPAVKCITNLLAVMNGRFAGGGMMFAPSAEPDDGQLEVVSTDRLTRPVLLRELTRIHRGGHIANPAVRVTSGARVAIETDGDRDRLPVEADGNVRGWTPAEFRVMPRALRIVV